MYAQYQIIQSEDPATLSDSLINTSLYPNPTNLRLINHRDEQLLALETFIFDKLHGILSTINPMRLSNYYFRAVLDSRDLFPIVKLLDSQKRIEIACELMNYAEKTSYHENFSASYLQSLLPFYKTNEKVELLKYLSDGSLSFAKQDFIKEVFYSAKSLKNLNYLVINSKIESKNELRNREIKDFIATAAIGTMLCAQKLPAKPKKNTTMMETKSIINELKNYLLSCLKTIDDFKSHSRTDAFKEYKSGIRNILYTINNSKNNYSRKTKKNNPTVSLRAFCNELFEILDVLQNFRISLSSSDSKIKVKSKDKFRDWEIEEIRSVKKAIEIIGAGRVLSTPLLFEIKRYSDYEYCGRRTEDGSIILSDSANDQSGYGSIYPKVTEFQAVAVHEMMHGIQWGRKLCSRADFDPQNYRITGPADPRSCFEEFAMLSDWKIFRNKYTLDTDSQYFTSKGRKIKFHVPEYYNSEKRIFVYSAADNQIFSFFSEARFGFKRSFDSVPEEDYVESATDYLLSNGKAIEYEPDKFLFFERLFRKFDQNLSIQRKLTKNLSLLMGKVLTIEDLYNKPQIIKCDLQPYDNTASTL